MYTPKFTINNEILRNIGSIEACREVIDNAPLVPAWEKQFQQEALERTIHYGTHIEGNELTYNEAVKVLEGQHIAGRERDIQEVINYRNTMKYIDELGEKSDNKYTEEQLKKIISNDTVKITPEFRKNEILSFLSEGLNDVSFSRSADKMPWGIPVPENYS